MKLDLIKETAVPTTAAKYTGPAVAKIIGTVNPSKEDLAKIYGPQKEAPVYTKKWPSGETYQLISFLLEIESIKKTKTIEFQLENKLAGSADGTKVVLMNEWGDILHPMDEATFNRLKSEGNKQVMEFCANCSKTEFKDFYKLRKGEDALVVFLQKFLNFRPKARLKTPNQVHVKWIDICDGNYKEFFDKLQKGDTSVLLPLKEKVDNKVGVQLVVEVSDKGGEYEKVAIVKDSFFEHWVTDGSTGMKKYYDYRINSGTHPERLPRWSEKLQEYDSAKSYRMIPASAEDVFGFSDDSLPF